MKRKSRRQKTTRPFATAEKALKVAWQFHRDGRFDDAKMAYEQVLRIHPDCVEAIYLLGVLSHRIGDPEASIALLRQAVTLRPGFTEAQNDLGNVLHAAGMLDEAACVFRELIQSKPQHADAHNNLGVVLKAQGKHEEALTAFQKAIRLDPMNVGQQYNLGNVLKRLGRFGEAVAAYRSVIELEPSHSEAYRNLAAALRRAERLDESQEALRAWLRQDPDNPIACHMLAACSDKTPPERASDAYVLQVFNRFAKTFDEELLELGYLGPQLMAAAISQEYNPEESSLDVLDAGCGTGLCGPVLRRYARKLVGVDLSPAMLDRARRLNVYDKLAIAELTAYLNESCGEFDLIACADTVNYFGTLTPLLAAAAVALRDDGCLIFTDEEDNREHSGLGYRLGHHGRYAHTVDYIRKCATEAGLAICGITSSVIRQDAGQPVAGLVVRARK
jgi:predicted TPR repeat methyltransferase